MNRIKKENVIIDHRRQGEEKNIFWGDYPIRNALTDRKLKKNLDFYFSSLAEYFETHEKECKRLGFRYEF